MPEAGALYEALTALEYLTMVANLRGIEGGHADGIDANAALVVKELPRELASQGRTILFCSHILEVVERICTRIVDAPERASEEAL